VSLPIEAVLDELRTALAAHPAVVLQAPPGGGKTTRVPLALLQESWLDGRTILMLEPRRLAARAAAARMAETLGENVGATIGYRVRFDTQVSARTRVEVLTEGILTRRLQHDPELAGVGLVIFDEFHERSLHADLGLALCLDIQQGLREDLKILLMSATLDGARIAALLDQAPLVQSAGRAYPVEIFYRPPGRENRLAEHLAQEVRALVPNSDGDILAFLPGSGEIRRAAALLTDLPPHIEVIGLYGDLPKAAQDAAICPAAPGRRKIVLATNIAETSLTIEGVRTVVDSGWQRAPCFDPRAGLGRLLTRRVSHAAAAQRCGRAGRTAPGRCYRLWAESTRLGEHSPAEILEADLAPLALELAQWGVTDATALRWLDAPPPAALAQARELLYRLEALDADGRITALGQAMAAVPAHPRLAHMLCRANPLGWRDMACALAALLGERDILRAEARRDSNINLRLDALRAWESRDQNALARLGADREACKRVAQSARQLGAQTLALEHGQAGVLLALAYPDRIGQRRPGGLPRFRLSNGRGAFLNENDSLSGDAFIAVAETDGDAREARIFLAAPLTQAEVEKYLHARIETRAIIEWDGNAVQSRRDTCLGALVLTSAAWPEADADKCAQVLLDAIRTQLPWDEAARVWQTRVLCLRQWLPEQAWPDVSDAALEQDLAHWLAPYVSHLRRLSEVRKLKLADILTHLLDYSQQRALAELAPTHIEVPSGSRLPISYQTDGVPVLAVRLQEVFGWCETPRIAGGRVALQLHLLSPARRPIQVTQDLQSFWTNTYADVKKELKGRYPKHYWPEDPWNAIATHRVRPKS
jgi:ATP-dependent helicase HrpB